MENPMPVSALRPRQQSGPSNDPTQEFFKLVQDPFNVRHMRSALLTSLYTSLGITLVLAIFFSILRPHYTTVYAPRLKRAQDGHRPPPVGKGLFAWLKPIRKTGEAQLVDAVGLDAAVFLRFTRMCRNMFLIMTLVGCGVLIPANITGSVKEYIQAEKDVLRLMTPRVVFGKPLWAQVACAWLFDLIIAFFLHRNYRAVSRLRRGYFESDAYQARLHSRTLLVTDIPPKYRSDSGVHEICGSVKSTSNVPRSVIGHDVKGLSQLIREHEQTVRKLESYLAKYTKNPNKLPATRPRCKPAKRDTSYSRDKKVDAIDYLTGRMERLEVEIKRARENIDLVDVMPYGFSSYDTVGEAHAVAYRARGKRRNGALIRLAPPPEDIIWDNLPITRSSRRWRKVYHTLWVALLTVIWIAPNAMIAIFLANLYNLGRVWPAFNRQLNGNWRSWAAVQGIASPAVLSLVYLLLPILFRRLSIRSGTVTTKTQRERHVLRQLYAFFIFNNLLIFTSFSAIWQFITAVIKARNARKSVMDAFREGDLWTKLLVASCDVSPFWVSWLLQRHLGAAVDLVQVFNLVWIWFTKTFLSQTPRQLAEWMRPPPFDYASYYNYFLFYATVTLCFATLQPVVLPVTALYFTLDSWLKKYLLLYVFMTKTESGGQFWRTIFNRMVFAAILANIVVGLVVSAREEYTMAYAMVPAPLLMIAFKIYCKKTFDDDMHYYRRYLKDSEGLPLPSKESLRHEKLAKRFENPVFYRPLIAPMVFEKAKPVVDQIYRGRLQSDVGLSGGYGGGSGGIHLDAMSEAQPGKAQGSSGDTPFRFVPESLAVAAESDALQGGLMTSDGRRMPIGGMDDPYDDDDARRPMDLISERPDTPGSYYDPYASSSHHAAAASAAASYYSRTASPASMLSSSAHGGGGGMYPSTTHPQDIPPLPPLSRSTSALSQAYPPSSSSDPGVPPPLPPPGMSYYQADPNESHTSLLRDPAPMASFHHHHHHPRTAGGPGHR